MFSFFSKKTKYISCDLIEHGLDFFTDSINFCCRIPPDDKAGYKKILDNYYGEKINWKNFFKIKRQYRNEMKKGNIPVFENICCMKGSVSCSFRFTRNSAHREKTRGNIIAT